MKEGSEGLERFTSRAVKSAAMDAPIDESTILAWPPKLF